MARIAGVVGVFEDRADAERAVEELRRAGFRDSQIGILYRDKKRKGRKDGQETLAEEGGVTGAVAGAGVGALVGLGILAGAIPGIGPAITGGTLAVLLANAAGGAAIAGLAGALIGLGIPEDDAAWYEKEVKGGRTVVTVRVTSRQEEAREILRRHNGYDISTAPGSADGAATASRSEVDVVASETGETLKVHEEELHARKRPVKTGEVKVRKEVVTEHQTLDVPVTREEVYVERRPAGNRRTPGAAIRGGEEVRVPVHEEQVTVEKTPVVREEVRVGKRSVTGTERVSGNVRKERVRVEKEGAVNVREKRK